MDITSWLRDLECPGMRDPVDRTHDQPDRQRAEAIDADRRRRHGRFVPSGDCSSLIGAEVHEPDMCSKQLRKRARNTCASDKSHIAPSCTSARSAGLPHRNDETEECFERRPRRKTRLEIYQPGSNARKRRNKSKRPRKPRNDANKDETCHHTLKRHKADKTGHAMLRSFNTTSVSSDRLTVSEGLNVAGTLAHHVTRISSRPHAQSGCFVMGECRRLSGVTDVRRAPKSRTSRKMY